MPFHLKFMRTVDEGGPLMNHAEYMISSRQLIILNILTKNLYVTFPIEINQMIIFFDDAIFWNILYRRLIASLPLQRQYIAMKSDSLGCAPVQTKEFRPSRIWDPGDGRQWKLDFRDAGVGGEGCWSAIDAMTSQTDHRRINISNSGVGVRHLGSLGVQCCHRIHFLSSQVHSVPPLLGGCVRRGKKADERKWGNEPIVRRWSIVTGKVFCPPTSLYRLYPSCIRCASPSIPIIAAITVRELHGKVSWNNDSFQILFSKLN